MSYPLQKDCAFLQSHAGQPCQTNDKKKSHRTVTFLFMACPAGFEPVTLRVGVSRAIQLCHGQIWRTMGIIRFYIISYLHRFVKYFSVIPLDKFFDF